MDSDTHSVWLDAIVVRPHEQQGKNLVRKQVQFLPDSLEDDMLTIIVILLALVMLREFIAVAHPHKNDWFIIFLTWHDCHGNRQFENIDGVYGTYEGALNHAHRNYELRKGECFAAELCLSPRNIAKAKQLAMRARREIPDDWTKNEFIAFMSQPPYYGDYSKHMRQRK